jgi:hypothetical protein
VPRPRFRLVFLAALLCGDIVAQPLTSDPGEQSIAVAVRVFGGGDCIRRPAIATAVESWLGTNTLPADWTVVVAVEGELAQFSIFERGRLLALRRFESMHGECADREAVVGASIGLSLEALLTRRAEADQDRAEQALAQAPPAPQRQPEGSPRSLTVQGTFAPTTLMSPAAGGSLTFEFGTAGPQEDGSRPWRTRLGVMSLWAEPIPLNQVADAELITRLLAGRIGQCWGRGTRAWRLQACTDVLAGYMSGRGRGDLRELGAHLPWLAWGAGVEGRWWLLEPLALSVGAQANLQLVRPRFRVVTDSGGAVEEFRAPTGGFMFHAGVTWSYR